MSDQVIDLQIRARAILGEAQKQIATFMQEVDKSTEATKKKTMSLGDMAKVAGVVGGAVTGLAAGIGVLGARGADVLDLRDSFAALNIAIGNDAVKVLATLRTSFAGTRSDAELMKLANEALTAGLHASQKDFELIADAARVLADRTGGDASQAFKLLAQAMATGKTKGAELLIGVIDNDKAIKTYAASLGKATKDLTEQEKIDAVAVATKVKLEEVVQLNGKAQEDFADKVDQSKVKLGNFVNGIGEWVATSPQIGQWSSLITAVSGSLSAVTLAAGPLVSALGTAIPAAAGVVVPLFTTTIPAAFSAVLPFLGPVGLIAAGAAAVFAVWKNWDTIAGFAKGVYDGVKTWLVDKFTAIIDNIKGKIDAVTGFFGDMYDKVVGNSYVPDMVTEIGEHMDRLDEEMVLPAEEAVARTKAAFASMSDSMQAELRELETIVENDASLIGEAIPEALTPPPSAWQSLGAELRTSVGNVLKSLPETFTAAFTGGGGLLGAFKAIGVQLTDAIMKPMMKGLSELQQKTIGVASGLASALGGRAAGGVGAAIGGIASGLGGAALAATSWGTSMAAAGVMGTVALSAATMGIGAAAVGVYMLGKHWFGVSKEEKVARELVGAFKQSIAGALTQTQLLEAGTEDWKQQVVGIRDAYIRVGHTEQEALDVSSRLWAAEKDGPEAVKRVIAEISTTLTGNYLPATQQANAIAVLGWQGVLGLIEDSEEKAHDAADAVGEFGDTTASSLDTAAAIGAAALDSLTDDVAALAAAVGPENHGLTMEIQSLQDRIQQAAAQGVTDFSAFADEVAALKLKMSEPITISATLIMDAKPQELINAGHMSPAQKRAMIEQFLRDNPGDWARIPAALGIPLSEAEQLMGGGDSGGTPTPPPNLSEEDLAHWAEQNNITMHAGGPVRRAHRGVFVGERLAADEVPIIAQTGEGVLSRRGMQALGGESVLNRLNQGAAGSMTVVNNVIVIDESGQIRRGSLQHVREDLRKLVQDLLTGGGLQVPQRIVVARVN